MAGRVATLCRRLVFQVVLMVFLAALPLLWWRSLGISEAQQLADVDPAYFLVSCGLALVSGGLAYVLLPLDVIPDFIPILGRLDDGVAYIVIAAGVVLAGLGAYLFAADQGGAGDRLDGPRTRA